MEFSKQDNRDKQGKLLESNLLTSQMIKFRKIDSSTKKLKNNFKQMNKFKKMIFPKLRNLCSKIIIRTCLALTELWDKKVISEIQTYLSPKNKQMMKRSPKVQ